MIFYLPPSRDKADLKLLIENHGGITSDFHECFTYQIAPLTQTIEKLHYFLGDVHQGHWLVESVKQGKMLDNKDYFAFKNTESGSKRIDFIAERIKYTITEGMKIFEIGVANEKT